MELAKFTAKGQVTIPITIRKRLGLETEDDEVGTGPRRGKGV